jgi:uroporphyrinogen-III decarboxylase
VAAGVDIVNPVQISAAGMDPAALKARWGDKLVFWGGGVDTQRVLAFGTPEEVRENVQANVAAFSPHGGFIFSAVHNIQATVPTANLVALFEALNDYR